MFDVTTAYLLWMTQAGTLTLLLTAIWMRVPRRQYLLYLALGFAAQATGLLLVVLRGLIPDVLSIQIGNGLMLLPYGLWGIALLHLAGGPSNRMVAVLLAPTALWLAGNLVAEIAQSFANRVMLFNGLAALHYAILAAIITGIGEKSRGIRIALGLTWLTSAVTCLCLLTGAAIARPNSYAELPFLTLLGLSIIAGFVAAIGLMTRLLIDRSEDYLQKLVRTDPLTGVLNRRGFMEAFEIIRTSGGDGLIALVVFDIDHFKLVNDTYGHAAGDRALQHFSRMAEHLLPQGAALGRTGGEEFSAALPIGQVKDAVLYAETLRQTLQNSTVPSESSAISITVSIGLSAMQSTTGQLDRLMLQADKALYLAKESGRNRVAIWNRDEPICLPSDESKELDDLADRQVSVLNRLSAAALRNLA